MALISRPISARVASVSAYSRSDSNSRAVTMAWATCAPNWRRIHSSRSWNAPSRSLSRLSAPMTLPLWRSGTTSCDFAPGTTARYRGSASTSLSRIGRCSVTAAPTTPWSRRRVKFLTISSGYPTAYAMLSSSRFSSSR